MVILRVDEQAACLSSLKTQLQAGLLKKNK
jgi:hypothetical protein